MKNVQYKNIDAYIRTFPQDTQKILEKVRKVIAVAVPKAEEGIKYQMPTFMLEGKNLVHFAAWKNHIGFYPTPSPLVEFKKELSKYEMTKGAVQFPLDKPIPLTLIKKMVRLRVTQLSQNK